MAGFADPIHDSQSTFRVVLEAMSQPGRIVSLDKCDTAPAGVEPATAAVCLCLLDHATRLWLSPALSDDALINYFRFHTGTRITESSLDADFAIVEAPSALEYTEFHIGTPEYPDRSTTAIVQCAGLVADSGPRLTGPGIQHERRFDVEDASSGFWTTIRRNQALFPLGVDHIFVSGRNVVCLPRSTTVED